MAFPSTPLDIRVQVALDSPDLADPSAWVWTDATSYVKIGEGISIGIGRSDQYAQMPASRLTLTVKNNDGRWTRTNPTGAWYGRLGRNTPIRVQVNNGSGYKARFTGTIDAFPPTWDYTGRYAVAQISASGALRRVERQGSARSALFLSSTSGYYSSGAPVAYWPCEDRSGSTQIASGIGGPPMHFSQISLGSDSDIAGSEPLPVMGADPFMGGMVPAFTSTGEWAIRFVMRVPAAPSATIFPVGWFTPGGAPDTWGFTIDPGLNRVRLEARTAGVEVLADSGGTIPSTGFYDTQLYVEINATRNGAGIDWNFNIWSPNGTGFGSTGSEASATFANPSWVQVAGQPAFVGSTIGHIAVGMDTGFGASVFGATGYDGEAAAFRWNRIGNEANLPWDWSLNDETPMGAQSTNTLIEQIREIGDAEGVPIYDSLDGFLLLPARADRYNQAVALSLSFTGSQIQPPQPTDDDRYIRNDVTVSRPGGSSHRTTRATGTNSTAIGVYEDSQSINVWQDVDLPYRSQWLVHHGTVDELRYPSVDINMASRGMTTAKINDWLLCTPGSRIQLTNPGLPGLAPDTVDLLLEGWSEFLRYPREWTVSATCSPYAPWSVFQIEDDSLGRLDTAGSTLTAAASAGAAALTVATTSGPQWSTTAVPYDISVGGERITVTAVGDSVTDSFDRGAVSSSWGTATTGQTWILPGLAASYSTTGTLGRINTAIVGQLYYATLDTLSVNQTVTVEHILPVVPTVAGFVLRTVARWTDFSNNYQAELHIAAGGAATLNLLRVAGGVGTVIGSSFAPGTHSAGDLWITVLDVSGSTIRAKTWDFSVGDRDPGIWQVIATDTSLTTGTQAGAGVQRETGNTNGATNVDFNNFVVSNPQAFTVTRAVNGVSKAQTAGTAVTLWRPGVGGLAL